jgi:hypothetical protein
MMCWRMAKLSAACLRAITRVSRLQQDRPLACHLLKRTGAQLLRCGGHPSNRREGASAHKPERLGWSKVFYVAPLSEDIDLNQCSAYW